MVEILSPKTARLDRENKRRVYATSGVRELWIIAPETRADRGLSAGAGCGQARRHYGEKDNFESGLFPGLRFEAARIFAQ